MPTYRIRPGAIPKHLRVPQPLPSVVNANSQHAVKGKPPIRTSTVSVDSQLGDPSFSSAADATQSAWFRLPRARAEEKSWFARTVSAKRAAAAHPHAKLREPMSLRIYDLIAMGSIPALLVYFLFYAPGGDKSDALVLRRWSAGIQQDVKDWWTRAPRDEEVDPQVLLELEKRRISQQ